MAVTGYSSFDTIVHKTNRILRELETQFGWPKERREQSHAALRAVLHAIRDRLTVQEAADFSAQLPMLVRGVFIHGWRPSKVPVKMQRGDFLEQVRQEFPFDLGRDLDQDEEAELVVKTVTAALALYVSEGETEDIRSLMPKDTLDLLP